MENKLEGNQLLNTDSKTLSDEEDQKGNQASSERAHNTGKQTRKISMIDRILIFFVMVVMYSVKTLNLLGKLIISCCRKIKGKCIVLKETWRKNRESKQAKEGNISDAVTVEGIVEPEITTMETRVIMPNEGEQMKSAIDGTGPSGQKKDFADSPQKKQNEIKQNHNLVETDQLNENNGKLQMCFQDSPIHNEPTIPVEQETQGRLGEQVFPSSTDTSASPAQNGLQQTEQKSSSEMQPQQQNYLPAQPFLTQTQQGNLSPTISKMDWFIYLILMLIPFVNIIVIIVCAFDEAKPSRANFARVQLILLLIVFLFFLFFWGILLTAIGSAF